MLDAGQEPYGTERLDWETGAPVSTATGSPDAVSPESGQAEDKAPKAP